MTAPLQLYSLATPNGQKVSIALEEMGLTYDAHTINIMEGDQFTESFIRINPNSKIPALVDLEVNGERGLPIMESGAILLYLAEKTGKFIPQDPIKRMECLQWLFWQMGGLGPMFGQFGHFTVYADKERDLSYGQERYTKEAKRLLQVLETQLEGKKFIIGDELTIADFAIMPWVVCLDKFYKAKETLELDQYPHINAWVESLLAREGVERGMKVCAFPEKKEG